MATPSLNDWKDIALTTLKGRGLESLEWHNEDGLLIKPLYTEADRPAAEHAGRLDAGWQIAQLIEPAADAGVLNRMILDELEGGAGMVLMPPDQDAAMLPQALEGVRLEAARFGFMGGDFQQTAETIMAAGQKAGIKKSAMCHVLAGDPIKDAERAAIWLKDNGAVWTGIKPVTIAGDHAHESGHTDAGELAIMLASLVHVMRIFDATGLTAAESLPRIHLRFAVGVDLYSGIAKVRATQQVIARFAEACGVEAAPLLGGLHGISSARQLTRLDVDTNILRNGTALLAMVLGGVGVATSLPHDWLTGTSFESRRLARNSHHIMAAEARLDQIADPAAGSFYIDRLTHDLAEKAWQDFQAIEAEGGITAASGRLAGEAEAAVRQRQDAVNRGRERLLGVTRHPKRDAMPAPIITVKGAGPRGGDHRPAAAWEALFESYHGRHRRILCLDIGASKKAAEAASWLQLAGIDATVIRADTIKEGIEKITAANPEQLILGGDDEDLAAVAGMSEEKIPVTAGSFFDGDKLDALVSMLEGIK